MFVTLKPAFKIFKNLFEKVESISNYLSNLSSFVYFAIIIVIVELLKSVIMERLKVFIREASFV